MQIKYARTLSTAILASSIGFGVAPAFATESIARQWDETILSSIKLDLVRPPVQARNLFHLSVAMYDAWAAYDPTATGYFFTEKHVANDIEAARRETISYASYRLLVQRFAASPNAAPIRAILDARMAELGYPTNVTTTAGNTPAAVGNRLAAQLIGWGFSDNSHEEVNHASYAGTYPDVNPPLVVDLPFNFDVADANRYQPLALEFFVDQNGNVVPGGFPPKVCPFWGGVRPFGLDPADQDPKRWGVWFDTPDVPLLNGVGNDEYRAGHEARLRPPPRPECVSGHATRSAIAPESRSATPWRASRASWPIRRTSTAASDSSALDPMRSAESGSGSSASDSLPVGTARTGRPSEHPWRATATAAPGVDAVASHAPIP